MAYRNRLVLDRYQNISFQLTNRNGFQNGIHNIGCIYGTYNQKMRRLGKGDRKVVKKPRDSQRKNELITGPGIPINIYKG